MKTEQELREIYECMKFYREHLENLARRIVAAGECNIMGALMTLQTSADLSIVEGTVRWVLGESDPQSDENFRKLREEVARIRATAQN